MLKRLIFSVWIWTVLVAAAAISCFIMVPIALLRYRIDPHRMATGLIFRRTARLVGWLSPMWRFAAVKPFPPKLDRAYVVVSNHQSHLDAFLISFLPWEMKWLAKQSLFYLPIIGWAMFLAGDVAVIRTRGSSIGKAMERCRKLLDQGISVFIFPEGTRNKTHQDLQPFKQGAFRLALEAKVPVLPLGIWGTRPALPSGAFLFGWSKARVAVGDPVQSTPILARHTRDDTIDWSGAIDELTKLCTQAVARQMERARDALK